MDEIIAGLLKFSPLIGALLVPLISVYLKLRSDRQDPAAVRVLKQHAKLHDSLPESTRGEIVRLLEFETKKYADAQIRRGKRRVNGTSLATLIFVAAVTGAAVYWLIVWALIWWPAFIGVGLVAFFGGALMVAGGFQLFTYDESPAEASEDPAGEKEIQADVETKELVNTP